MTDHSIQFFVVKLADDRFKICVQDDKTILRSYETDSGGIIDCLYRELNALKPVQE